MTAFIIAVIAAVVGCGYAHLTGKHDSCIEQAAEFVIKEEIGLSIDLSKDMKDKREVKTSS